jgi:hypothetical protein
MVLCGPTKDENGLEMAWRLCNRVGDRGRAPLALTEPAYEYGWDAEKRNEW